MSLIQAALSGENPLALKEFKIWKQMFTRVQFKSAPPPDFENSTYMYSTVHYNTVHIRNQNIWSVSYLFCIKKKFSSIYPIFYRMFTLITENPADYQGFLNAQSLIFEFI